MVHMGKMKITYVIIIFSIIRSGLGSRAVIWRGYMKLTTSKGDFHDGYHYSENQHPKY